MASTKILAQKKETVNDIVNNIKDSESVILFQYQGLTVAELSELRKKLRETDATVKVYKNTLLKFHKKKSHMTFLFVIKKLTIMAKEQKILFWPRTFTIN